MTRPPQTTLRTTSPYHTLLLFPAPDMATPSVACIGIIGKHVPLTTRSESITIPQLTSAKDNPLHIALFPPHTSIPSAHLEFSFLLNASLDIFDALARDRNRVDQDLGMLQAIDERLSIWGWETGTGARFAVVVDAWGRSGNKGSRGVSDGDLRGVSCSTLCFCLGRGWDGGVKRG